MERGVMDYHMIAPGDRVLVGVSGGADSMSLLHLLTRSMVHVQPFEVVAVHVNMGFLGGDEDSQVIASYVARQGISCIVHDTSFGPLAHSDYNRKNPCFLCSRLRRKNIFETARDHGCNKIALAHNRDDIIETLLINLFYGREISTMMPCQPIFGGRLHIIRPLVYLEEKTIRRYAQEQTFPLVPERCPTAPSSRRRYVKELVRTLERENKQLRHNIWTAMSHVKPDYLPTMGEKKHA